MNRPIHSISLMNVRSTAESDCIHCLSNNTKHENAHYIVNSSSSMFDVRTKNGKMSSALLKRRHSPDEVLESWRKESREIESLRQALCSTTISTSRPLATTRPLVNPNPTTTTIDTDMPTYNTRIEEPMDIKSPGGNGYFLRSKGCVNCLAFRKHTRCFQFGNTNCNSLTTATLTLECPINMHLPTLSYSPIQMPPIVKQRQKTTKIKKTNERKIHSKNIKTKNEIKEGTEKKRKLPNSSGKVKSDKKKIKSVSKVKVHSAVKPTTTRTSTPCILPRVRKYATAGSLCTNLLKSRTFRVARICGLFCCKEKCCLKWRFPKGYEVYFDHI